MNHITNSRKTAILIFTLLFLTTSILIGSASAADQKNTPNTPTDAGLNSIAWTAETNQDGLAYGTLTTTDISLTSTDGSLNGGEATGSRDWATLLGTNDVANITDSGVNDQAVIFDWNTGAAGEVRIDFGGATVTDPILLVGSIDPQVETFDFEDSLTLALLDQYPANSVSIAANNVVTTDGTGSNTDDDGFALQLTGDFTTITFATNTNNGDARSITLSVAVADTNISLPDLVTVDWTAEVNADGLGYGTLGDTDISVTATDGPLNGGEVVNSPVWSTAHATNEVPGISSSGVHKYEGLALDWNASTSGTVRVDFGGATVTDPIFLFANIDAVVQTFDFDDGAMLNILDQAPGTGTTVAAGNVVTTDGSASNTVNDGFAVQLDGNFTTITFATNTNNLAANSVNFTVAADPANISLPDLATVDWTTDTNPDGNGTGTLAGYDITFTSTDGATNGGEGVTAYWSTSRATNEVSGISSTGVFKNDAMGLEWNAGTAGTATVDFGEAIVTNPILLFSYIDNVVQTFDFDNALTVTILDQDPADSVTVAANNVVTTNGTGSNTNHDGFAVQLTGNFTDITFATNTNLATNASVNFTVAADPANINLESAACWATIDGVTVYESLDSQAVRDAVAAATDGDLIKIAGICAGVDGSHLAAISGLELTLQGGYNATDWSSSDPVANLTILDAVTSGGILTTDSPLTVSNLQLQNGSTGYGGAIYSTVAVTVTNSDLISNTVSGRGGAVNATSLTITNSKLDNNRATAASDGYGGSAFWLSNDLVMDNSEVLNSYAAIDYTARVGGDVTMTDSIFAGNYVGDDSSAIAIYGDATITGSIFRENVNGNYPTSNDSVVWILGSGEISDVQFIRNHVTAGYTTLYLAEGSIDSSQFISNTVQQNGGALTVGTAVTVTNSLFQENAANQGAAISNSSGTLIVANSTFTDNTAASVGGAVYLEAGSMANITDSNFTTNTSGSHGGAIVNLGTATVNTSNFVGNHTLNTNDADGGAFYNNGGTLEINNSNFTNNSVPNVVSNEGGAIIGFGPSSVITVTGSSFISSTAYVGGAVTIWQGTSHFENNTLSNNTAGSHGGAFFLNSGTSNTLLNNTISNNTTTDTFGAGLQNNSALTILINNIIANSVTGEDCVNTGTLATNDNNLIEDNTCSPAVSGDPILGTLEFTGLGNTGILPLLDGSPAIDAGDTAAAPATDQRGVARPQGADADIGAYELDGEALSLEKTAVNITGAPLIAGDIIEYVVTVTNELGTSQAGISITDAIPAYTTYVAGSAQVSQGSVSGPDPLVADIGTLAAGASATITFRVTVDDDASGETIQNSAQASSPDQPDPIEVGPIEPAGGGLVLPSADLEINQSIELDFVKTIFTIVVDNNGPDAAPGTVVSVTFPVEITDITWTCAGSGGAVCPATSGSGNTIQETVATFPADGTLTYTVDTTPPWTPVTNMAEVIPSTDIVDPDMANNQSEQATQYIVILPIVFNNASFTP